MASGIETFHPPIKVEFDPENPEHLQAMALLHFHGRQHPSLRFALDPSKHSSVLQHMLSAWLLHTLPRSVVDYAEEYAASRAEFAVCDDVSGAQDDN